MEDSNIERKIRNEHQEKYKRLEEKKKKLNVINASLFENRKYIKDIFSLLPYGAISMVTLYLAKNGIILPELVPAISVIGGKFLGDVAEMVTFDKIYGEYKDLYNEMSESTKEGHAFSYQEKYENAKSEYYIAEKKYNHTLTDDFKKGKSIEHDNEYSKYSKSELQEELRQINIKTVLNKRLGDYGSKLYAICKHGAKTVFWTSQLILAYLVVQALAVGAITPMSIFVPAFIGGVAYGSYNYSVYKARTKIFKNNSKRLYARRLETENLSELAQKQEMICKNLGDYSIREEIEKDNIIVKPEESKYFVKREIEQAENNYYHRMSKEVFGPIDEENLDVTIGENSHAKILKKKNHSIKDEIK